MWQRLSDPAFGQRTSLLRLYGQALQARGQTAEMLDGIVESWLEPVAASYRAEELLPEVADAEARPSWRCRAGLSSTCWRPVTACRGRPGRRAVQRDVRGVARRAVPGSRVSGDRVAIRSCSCRGSRRPCSRSGPGSRRARTGCRRRGRGRRRRSSPWDRSGAMITGIVALLPGLHDDRAHRERTADRGLPEVAGVGADREVERRRLRRSASCARSPASRPGRRTRRPRRG